MLTSCNKILIFFFLFLLLSLFLLIGGMKTSVGKLLIENDETICKGDIYQLCKITKFMEKIPLIKHKQTKHSIYDASIITLGDSFFESSLASDKFSVELEKILAIPVFNINNTGAYFLSQVDMPLAFFETIKFVKGQRKILVLETVERYSIDRAKKYNRSPNAKSTVKVSNENSVKKIFNVSGIEYFYKNNLVTGRIYSLIQNIRFDLLGITDASCTYFRQTPDNIYLREDIDFNRSRKDDQTITEIVDYIARLSETLKDKYNIQLVYVIIPNKYSLYSSRIGEKYDNYIPRVVSELTKRHVIAVDIFTAYSQYMSDYPRVQLYFNGDTHYNNTGKRIVLQEVSKAIRKSCSLRCEQ